MIPGFEKNSGGVLLSHPASQAVPSALKSLTSVFGMGTGVTSSLSPPKLYDKINTRDHAETWSLWKQNMGNNFKRRITNKNGQASRPISTG